MSPCTLVIFTVFPRDSHHLARDMRFLVVRGIHVTHLLGSLSLHLLDVGINLSSGGLGIDSNLSALLLQGLLLSPPVVPGKVAVTLCKLGNLVDEVASEEEVVRWGDGERVTHESGGVDAKSGSHLSRNAMETSVSERR